MAGSRRALRLVLLLPAILGALLPLSAAAEPPKVSLAPYYESLCPYCSRFIVTHLTGIFDSGLINTVNLLLVPYGNTHVYGANNTISCQGSLHPSPSYPLQQGAGQREQAVPLVSLRRRAVGRVFWRSKSIRASSHLCRCGMKGLLKSLCVHPFTGAPSLGNF